MKKIILLSILTVIYTININAQGCYYGASATYTTNGGTVAFVNTSQMVSSSSWDFGDGNTSTLRDPVHTYSAIGSYTVTLSITYHWNMGVYGSFSCNSSVSGIVTISTLSAPPNVFGCTDPSMYNYNPQANLDDGTCVPFYYGCTDSTASNYSSWANTDDGSCLWCPTYEIYELTPGCPDNNNGRLGVRILSGDAIPNTSYIWTESINTSPYTVTTLPFTGKTATGLGSNFYDVQINHPNGCPTDYLYYQFNSTWGCTDSLASNYDATANCDDGSCIYTLNCGVITGVNLTEVIHDRATFNWDNMNSSSCVVDQIRIRYREVGTTAYSNKTMGAPVGNSAPCLNTSKLVLNLNASTNYEYDFKIWYQDGTINDWHSGGTFTTLPACDNATNITAMPLSSTATEFCWDTPSSPWSFVRLKYRVDTPGTSFSNIGGFGVMYPQECKTKNGLTPGTNYRVMWRTWCNAAGGPYRSPVWDGPVTWTQTSSSRLEGKNSIANLDVYPNPSRDVFNISFTSETIQDLQVRVLNIVGEEIVLEKLQQFVGEYVKKINLNMHSKGIYFLEIKTKNGVSNKKLILQ